MMIIHKCVCYRGKCNIKVLKNYSKSIKPTHQVSTMYPALYYAHAYWNTPVSRQVFLDADRRLLSYINGH